MGQVGDFPLPSVPVVAIRSVAVFPEVPFKFIAVGTDNGVHLLTAEQDGTPAVQTGVVQRGPGSACAVVG